MKGIKPFVLYFNRESPWLCVPTLLYEWLHVSSIRDGYLFRSISAFDQVNLVKNASLASGLFLSDFRANLADVGIEAEDYGGHSFRRGGVQYFSEEKRWSIQKLCEWGGWSMDFDNLTIVRYLIGTNGDFDRPREEFMNPSAHIGILCSTCGRSCSHA